MAFASRFRQSAIGIKILNFDSVPDTMPAPQLPPPEPDDPPGSFLFSDSEIDEITDAERKRGRYTLANLPPQKRQAILVLLKERRPFREVGRLVGVAWETVQAVANAYAAELDRAWNDFPKALRRVNWYLVDRLQQNVGSFPVQSIPLAVKLLSDTSELLEGRATARIDHTTEPRRVSNLEEYERIIGTLEKKVAGRVIDPDEEPGPEMHLGAGNPAVITAGAGFDDQPPAAAPPGDPPAGRSSHFQSDVLGQTSQANGRLESTLETTESPET